MSIHCNASRAEKNLSLEMSLHEVKQLQLNDLDVFNSLFWWQWLEMASEMEWSEMKKKQKNYWRPSQSALVSRCLSFLYIWRESEILLCYTWRKIGRKGNAQIFARLFIASAMCLRVCVLVCSAQLSDFFQLFFLSYWIYTSTRAIQITTPS